MSPGTGLLSLVIIIIGVLAAPPATAEDPEPASHESMRVEIGQSGDMHVTHTIKSAAEQRMLRLAGGNAAGLSVQERSGGDAPFTASDDAGWILLEPSETGYTVKYDLPGGVQLVNGIWTLDFEYSGTVEFAVPDAADLIFVNGNPVYLGGKSGIACHGCNMLLEYTVQEQRTFIDVAWEENEFLVELRADAGMDRFWFDQPSKTMRFDVKGGGEFVTAIIPSELLGGPYAVLLDGQRIDFEEYNINGTHTWINARPDGAGRIEIIGTTAIPEFSLMASLVIGLVAAVAVIRSGGAGLLARC